jgi:3-methyladenine DNA glycosylase AlkC
MNFIKESLSRELADPFISLQTLSEWTGQSVSTLRNESKRGRLEVKRLSPRCLRVRLSEAKRYAALLEVVAA